MIDYITEDSGGLAGQAVTREGETAPSCGFQSAATVSGRRGSPSVNFKPHDCYCSNITVKLHMSMLKTADAIHLGEF